MSVLQTELEGAIPSRVTNFKLLRGVISNASVSETEVPGAIPGEAAMQFLITTEDKHQYRRELDA